MLFNLEDLGGGEQKREDRAKRLAGVMLRMMDMIEENKGHYEHLRTIDYDIDEAARRMMENEGEIKRLAVAVDTLIDRVDAIEEWALGIERALVEHQPEEELPQKTETNGKKCEICDAELSGSQEKYCSEECAKKAARIYTRGYEAGKRKAQKD